MITCQELFNIFRKIDLRFFTGVPDSCFAPLVNYLIKNSTKYNCRHIIATNEGEALAIGVGYYLSTGKIPVIYLQNDGLCNMMNPLTSLTDKHVYQIPSLLLISWRGAPNTKDAPQHTRMGKILLNLLKILEISYFVYNGKNDILRGELEKIIKKVEADEKPFAIIFKKGDIANYPINYKDDATLTREKAIEIIASNLENGVIVATTGKASRELFEYRERTDKAHKKDFLNIGAMGFANAIAFGISLNTDKKVFVIDGDGALFMHMGNLATIGHYQPKNLYHIVLNNFSHDSTGGQPTVANTVDFCSIAKAVGYKYAKSVKSEEELKKEIKQLQQIDGPAMIVVNVKRGARKNLGRPTISLKKLKEDFMRYVIK